MMLQERRMKQHQNYIMKELKQRVEKKVERNPQEVMEKNCGMAFWK